MASDGNLYYLCGPWSGPWTRISLPLSTPQFTLSPYLRKLSYRFIYHCIFRIWIQVMLIAYHLCRWDGRLSKSSITGLRLHVSFHSMLLHKAINIPADPMSAPKIVSSPCKVHHYMNNCRDVQGARKACVCAPPRPTKCCFDGSKGETVNGKEAHRCLCVKVFLWDCPQPHLRHWMTHILNSRTINKSINYRTSILPVQCLYASLVSDAVLSWADLHFGPTIVPEFFSGDDCCLATPM